MERYIYRERERVKNALFISLMKIYGRFQTVKQLILKHCCWLLLPPLTSSFWGLWMTWYVLTLRFVPECEIFVSVCHNCWNIWCCFQWRVVVYMFIYLQIKTSGTFHMKWKHLCSLLSPKFIFLFIFHRTEFFFLWIYYIIYLFIIEGQIWLSHPCRGHSGTLCALSSSEWWCVYLMKIHWPWS